MLIRSTNENYHNIHRSGWRLLCLIGHFPKSILVRALSRAGKAGQEMRETGRDLRPFPVASGKRDFGMGVV
jgi:hypothetical protein